MLSNFDKYCEQKKLPVSLGKGLKRKLPKDETDKSPLYPLENPDYVSVSIICCCFF